MCKPNSDSFDTVEGIILLLVLKRRFLGVVSIACLYFWKFCDGILMERETNAKGENGSWTSWSFSSILFMVAGWVWYLSGVTVFRLERLGTGCLFRNTLPIKEEWLEMVNCNCGQTVCVLNKGTALHWSCKALFWINKCQFTEELEKGITS